MLSDDELQAIADEYVMVEIPSCGAKWACELDDPPGVYFQPYEREPDLAVRNMDLFNWEGRSPHTLRIGFFVYRVGGELRVIQANDISRAAHATKTSIQDQWRIPPETIRYILTSVFREPLHRRPWWKFW